VGPGGNVASTDLSGGWSPGHRPGVAYYPCLVERDTCCHTTAVGIGLIPHELSIAKATIHQQTVNEMTFNPLTPTAIKQPVPDRVKPSFVIFDIRAL